MTTMWTLADIERTYPDVDAEWLFEDYRTYWRWFEEDQDAGNDPGELMSFPAWLNDQPDEYLRAHGVIQ